MHVITLSTDARLFEKESAVRNRMIDYGAQVDKLDVVVYTTPGHMAEQLSPNVTIYPTNTRLRLWYFVQAYFLSKKLLSEHVLVASQEGATNVVALLLKFFHAVRLHVEVHTDFLSQWFWREKMFNTFRYVGYVLGLRYADSVRVVSGRIRDAIVKKRIIRDESKISVLPIYVDVEKIAEYEPKVDLHTTYPQFEKIVLVLSRLEPEKDIMYALEALQGIVPEQSNVGLVIVGSGSQERALQEKVKELGIEDTVVFESWTNDPYSYYKTADIFLLTSRYEGYGMTLIEAAAAQCAIVTTDVGIVGSVLAHEENAYVCAPQDIGCFKKGLLRMCGDTAYAKALGENAHKSVREHITRTYQEYVGEYVALWERAFDNEY